MTDRMMQRYKQVRRFTLIREEISDLLEMIAAHKKLIEEYPDKHSLKFTLGAYRERLFYLKAELEESRIVFREDQKRDNGAGTIAGQRDVI